MSEPVIKYLNLSGARVGVFESQPRAGHSELVYRAGCSGCLETHGSAEYPCTLAAAREWASKHAEQCRALPQPDEDQTHHRTLMIEYAERAAGILRGDGTQSELRDRNGSATVYLGLSDIYGRLSGV